MKIRPEVRPFLVASVAGGVLAALIAPALGASGTATVLGCTAVTILAILYFLYFFRDPERTPPEDADAIVSAAEGRLASVTELEAAAFRRSCLASGLSETALGGFLDQDVYRISVYLNPFNVHVNRAPLSGQSRFLGYFPGKHHLTIREKSSEENQHNSILIEHERTRCLLHQIVGPICRRVVYWLDHDQPVAVKRGERIGMMKFGSRLDLYIPQADVELAARVGDAVRAGETVVARLKARAGS